MLIPLALVRAWVSKLQRRKTRTTSWMLKAKMTMRMEKVEIVSRIMIRNRINRTIKASGCDWR